MSERIRYHLDEQMAPAVATGLRDHGIDVTTTSEVSLQSASDEEQLERARERGRVLVTHDADFLRLNAAGQPHAGIVYAHPERIGIGELVRARVLIHAVLAPQDMVNHVEFV